MLQPGRSSSIQWSHCGRPAGSIGIVPKANCVHLVYRHRAWGDQWQDMREIVPYTETRTCFGGRRRWFECPGCGRACRVLFGGPYRCRRCHGLHYSSQYQSVGSRTIGRLQALRTRLGGSGDLLEAFPARPKHMQWSTYVRLRANLETCEQANSRIDHDHQRRCVRGRVRPHGTRPISTCAHRDGLNDAGVLSNPHIQAAHLKIAREEINKALAIIERMILDRRGPSLPTWPSLPASILRRLCSGSL